MKKVLYAASTAGHLRSFHLPWLRRLKELGWTVHCAGSGALQCPDADRYFDLPFTKSMASPRNFAAARQLRGILKQERYDLVCVHTSLAAFFVRLAVRLAGKGQTRVLNVVHGYLFDDKTPFMKRTLLLGAEKLMAGVTDEIAVMNRQDLEIARKHRLCRGPVTMLPGIGVDFSPFFPVGDPERTAARQSFGIPDGAFVLVYAGEFSRRKNQSFLVRCLAEAPEAAVLLLPGRGSEQEAVRALTKELGLEGRVFLPGFVSDMPRAYAAADLCVSASRSEGLPFNVMEAMACGLCCLVSRVKGHEDLIEPGVTGLTYDYDDTEGFLTALKALMADRAGRFSMGMTARRQVLSRYGLEAAAAVYEPLLDPDRAEREARAE